MLYTTLVNYFSSYFYTWELFFHPGEICLNSSNSLCLILLAFETFILLKNTWIIIKESKIWAKKSVIHLFLCIIKDIQDAPASWDSFRRIKNQFIQINYKLLYVESLVSCCCLVTKPVQLFETPWTVTHLAPLSMEFSR